MVLVTNGLFHLHKDNRRQRLPFRLPTDPRPPRPTLPNRLHRSTTVQLGGRSRSEVSLHPAVRLKLRVYLFGGHLLTAPEQLHKKTDVLGRVLVLGLRLAGESGQLEGLGLAQVETHRLTDELLCCVLAH